MSLFSGSWQDAVVSILVRALVVFTVLPLHECAHGLVALKLGDRTAKDQGRLTLNPLKHFDPIGTTALLLTGIGWARAVPINPMNFKNPKRGMAVTALAGPLSNLLIALAAMILYKLLTVAGVFFSLNAAAIDVAQTILLLFLQINVSLAVFNLLPIPPLDGSRIATCFLSEQTYFKVMQYERYIFLALMLLLFTGVLDTPLYYIRRWVITGLDYLTYPIYAVARLFL
jgi:Zn-dependent protease